MIQSIKSSLKMRIISLLIAVGMILGTRTLHAADKSAEDAKNPEPAPATMPEVVVSGKAVDSRKKSYKPEKMSSLKYTEPLRDVPQTVTVIPEGVIKDQGATSLRDVLKNVPGISMQAGEGGGGPGGDFLSIRGFGARNDIYVDGVRDFGGYTRDPFNLEQVEVVKGPSSAYTGRGSTGGTVNLSSKTPKLDPFYRASVGVGTAEYKRVSMDINQPLKIKDKGVDGAAFRLNALFHDADVAGHEVIGDQRWGIAPSLALGLDTDTRLTLSYFQLNQDNMPTYGSPWVPNTNNALVAYRDQPSPASWNNFYGLTNRDREKTMTNIANVLFEHDFNDDVTLRNNFRWGRTHRDSILTAPRFQNVNTTNLNRQFQSRDQVDKILANQTDLLLNFATGRIEHAVVAGIEAIREKSTNRPRTASVVSTTDLWNPDPGDAYAGQIRYGLGENAATSKSMALYGFDTMKLGDHFELNGGLRWDYFKTDYTPTTGQNFESIDSALTWRAGFVYKPVEIGSFYIGYGTSINPSSEGLVSQSPLNGSTVSLEPEKSRTFEIGTKWDVLKERLSLSAAIFRTDKTNARTPGINAGDPPTVLDGQQRVEGIEFGATGNITDDWQVFSGYTIMRSKIRETNTAADVGKKMSHVPEHSFNIWTTYKLPFNFEIGTGVNFMDMRYANTSNTRKAPAYMLWDAMLAYTINEHYKLRLNAYNLTDQEYIDRIGGGHFISGPGRSATLTMDVEF